MSGYEIQPAQLGPMSAIGKGGQALIYRLDKFAIPGAPAPLVYKAYKSATAEVVSKPGLNGLIDVREKLAPKVQGWFDRTTAWPIRTVTEGSDVRGVLMPLIAPTFFQDLIGAGGRTIPSKPRNSMFLFVDPSRGLKSGYELPTSTGEREAICFQLALLLKVLHDNRVVFGDISGANVLYALRPRPRILLVDCDAARRIGTSAAVPQLHTPGWEPPEVQPELDSQTVLTDAYKLGLFILRTLAPAQGTSVSRDASIARYALDGPGRELLDRSISATPQDRPAAAEWCGYFHERYVKGQQGQSDLVRPATPAPRPQLRLGSQWHKPSKLSGQAPVSGSKVTDLIWSTVKTGLASYQANKAATTSFVTPSTAPALPVAIQSITIDGRNSRPGKRFGIVTKKLAGNAIVLTRMGGSYQLTSEGDITGTWIVTQLPTNIPVSLCSSSGLVTNLVATALDVGHLRVEMLAGPPTAQLPSVMSVY